MEHDPPFEPLPGSLDWLESDGALLNDDIKLTNLIVRVGMALNAIGAQMHAARAIPKRSYAVHSLLSHSVMITSAALTFEALVFTGKNMPQLRGLASSVENGAELSDEIGALLSGKHPASAVIARARNKLGFHWDPKTIEASIKDFARNESVIWIEFDGKEVVYHRLADEILVYSFLPRDTAISIDAAKDDGKITAALGSVFEAMTTVSHFFAACIHGYVDSQRGRIHRRSRDESGS